MTSRPGTMLAAALSLAERGCEVFPLRGKVPAIPKSASCKASGHAGGLTVCGQPGHGVLDASADLELVRAMWGRAGHNANIGMRVPAAWIVVDVDPRSGGLDWIARQPALTPTVGAISGREDGGRHHYYRRPEGWEPDRAALLRTGVDLKDHEGYVVVPPSIHPNTGRPYRWTGREHGVQPLPDWLRELLTAAPITTTSDVTAYRPRRSTGNGAGWKPMADFNRDNRIADILTEHGWTCVGTDQGGMSEWRHPKATTHRSAKLSADERFLYNFSTNSGLPPTVQGHPEGLNAFNVWKWLDHGGDQQAALRALHRIALSQSPPSRQHGQADELAGCEPRTAQHSQALRPGGGVTSPLPVASGRNVGLCLGGCGARVVRYGENAEPTCPSCAQRHRVAS